MTNNAEEKKKEKEKEAAKHADETIRSVDIPGMRAMSEARSTTAKVFWCVLLVIFTAILVWQLYKTISNYINSPIVSTYTITTVPQMDFPIVYICPTAYVSSLYLNKTPSAEKDAIALKEELGLIWSNLDRLANGNLSEPMPAPHNPIEHVDQTALHNMRRKSNYNETGPQLDSDLDAEHFFKNATVDLDNHARYCEFRVFMSEKIPCRNITREVLDPEYGKCYVVDVGARPQTVQSQALLMTFNVRSNWYPKHPLLAPLYNGVYLSVHRKFNVHEGGERVLLAPGSYYRVDMALQHQVFKSFNNPYVQKCIDNTSYPEFKIFNTNYTQAACQHDCAAQVVRDACGCVPPIDRSLFNEDVIKNSSFCKTKDVECIRGITDKPDLVNTLSQCRDNCQRPCEDWRYSIRATAMDLYKFGFEPGIPVHDLIFILVSYSQMEFTEFKQDDSKTIDQMIGDIGGELGLWLGAGMLTLVQLPLFFLTCCGCEKCGKGCKKRKATKKESTSE